jgi:glycosyltransferase involved in cell wall biosynthesis
VQHEHNGLLVPPRDPLALAAAIERLGRDAVVRTAMGTASRARARQRFDETAVVRRVMDTYEQVAARKGVPLGLVAHR